MDSCCGLVTQAAMLVAVDSARGAVEPVVEPDAVPAGQTAMIGYAHVVFLAANGGLAALQPGALTGIEPAAADALRNALLLVLAALVDDCGVALHGHGCSLSKTKGGSECQKSDAK